jgi:hypothetical protein
MKIPIWLLTVSAGTVVCCGNWWYLRYGPGFLGGKALGIFGHLFDLLFPSLAVYVLAITLSLRLRLISINCPTDWLWLLFGLLVAQVFGILYLCQMF